MITRFVTPFFLFTQEIVSPLSKSGSMFGARYEPGVQAAEKRGVHKRNKTQMLGILPSVGTKKKKKIDIA